MIAYSTVEVNVEGLVSW